VNREPIEPIGDRRAGRAARLEVGPEHVVIDEELRASAEEISKGRFSFVGLEPVILFDPNPRQLLPLPRQLIAAPRKFLLRLEQVEPGCEPLFMCSSFMFSHCLVSFQFVWS